MSGTLLVRGARQLLTLHGRATPKRGPALSDLGIIEDGAVLIEDGRISEVGLSRRVENLARAHRTKVIDATGQVVMPGFVDCHTHPVFGDPWLDVYESRDGLSAAPPGGLESIRNVAHASSATRLERDARQMLAGMARHGTTTLEAKSGYGLDETGELKVLRVHERLNESPLDVVSTFLCPNTVPPEFRGDAERYVAWLVTRLLPKIRRRRLARFVDIVCHGRGFSEDSRSRYLRTARKLGLATKVHSAQFQPDGCVRMAVALGATSVDHLNYASPGDIALLSRSDTMAVLLPGPVFHLGYDRYAPARALIKEGAAIALGTDFHPGLSPSYSMQMIIRLACQHMQMTPAEAICAATLNAAWASGCVERAGSLKPGKPGDLIIVNVPDYREIPHYFGVNLVRATVKRGVVIYGA